MDIEILTAYGTANTTASKGRNLSYIAVHYSSGYQSKKGAARGLCQWFANPNAQASADFSVDDVEICQYNEDIENRYCWAVGGGKYNTKGGSLYGIAKNSNCISIEIISTNSNEKITYPNDPAYSFTDAVLDNAEQLIRYLMKKYNIPAEHVIRHYDVNGKPCPGVIGWNADSGDESAWEAFKARLTAPQTVEVTQNWYRVRKSWPDRDSQIGAYTEYENAVDACLVGYSVFNTDGKAVYTAEWNAAGVPPDKQTFIDTVADITRDLYRKTRILPSVVIAQACLESGYGLGADNLPLTKVSNILGMKSKLLNSTWSQYSVWNGESITKITPEERNGKIEMVPDQFRVYDDYENCIRDYERFLLYVKNGAAYKYRSVQGKTDPAEVIHIIRTGGYATDSSYEAKVLRVIKENNLTKYDDIAVPEEKQTIYRVRIGIYANDSVREATALLLASKGYSTFSETAEGGTALYCGSYESMENAQERVDALKKVKVSGKYLAPVIVEK